MEERTPEDADKIERLKRAMYSRSLSGAIKEKPRRTLDLGQQEIAEDWQRPEAHVASSFVAPRTIGWMRGALKWILGVSIAFFIGAAGFFGYYFLFGSGANPVSPGNIDISVAGPLQVTSGEPAELQIAVVNKNRAALELADLIVTYPPGTRSPTDLSTDLPVFRIPLGKIEAGGRRQGTVSAVFAGREGDHATIQIELEYRMSGSSAIFVAKSTYEFVFASSPLSIAIEGNRETIAGQPFELDVTVSSAAATEIKDVIMTGQFPFGYTLASANPKRAESALSLWELGDFAPGEKKTVRLRGMLSGESGDQRVFRFTAGTRTDESQETMSAVLADYTHPITISRPFLDLAVSVNKDTGSASTVVVPNETVNIAVEWHNNLPTEIDDAVIVARLSGLDIDGATFRSTDGFYRSTDRAVLWDKTTTNGELERLAPGASGSVAFSFQMPGSDVLKALRNPKLDITVHAAGNRVSESGVPESLQSTATRSLSVASDLQLVARGLYYANPFGSTGPMPPTAEKETTYAIVFSITNTTSKITNATVRATLPSYVRWVGIYSPSSESVTFNPNDGTISWNVGTIEPGIGVDGSLPSQAAIAIGFTPSTSQIGQQPQLATDIRLTGKDAATGAVVERTARDITTNIAGDPGFSAANATVVRDGTAQ